MKHPNTDASFREIMVNDIKQEMAGTLTQQENERRELCGEFTEQLRAAKVKFASQLQEVRTEVWLLKTNESGINQNSDVGQPA